MSKWLMKWWRPSLGVLIVCAACVAIAVTFPSLDDDEPDQSLNTKCKYKRPSEPGPQLAKDTAVTAVPAGGSVNFGGARGWQFFDVVLETSEPITKDVVDRLVLDAPRRFYREGASLTTIFANVPTFTPPSLRSRKRVGVTMCINAAALPSGRYTGLVSVAGPENFRPVDLSFTINAKNADLFGWTLGVSLILSFFLLALKGASDRTDRATRDAAQKEGALASEQVRGRDPMVLLDPGWWLTTVVVLGLGAAAAYAVYSQSPAWGDEPLGAAISVAGAVFAPAGLKSVLTPR